jgi:hypothetical protein
MSRIQSRSIAYYLPRLIVMAVGLLLLSLQSFAQSACTLNPTSANVSATGGSGSFTVTGCSSFNVLNPNPWVHLQLNPGSVNYLVDPNPDLKERSASIGITPSSGGNGSAFLIFQSANPGDFSLSTQPTSQTVPRGSSAGFNVFINRTGGFTGQVSLSTPNTPPGITSSFSSCTTSSCILILKTDPNMATGPAVVPIQGANGNVTHTTSVTLTVTPQCSVACAAMQTDGNFVLYNAAGQALWSSVTSGSGAGIVRVQDDGNLVLYALTKVAGGVYAAPSVGPFPPQTCKIGTLLHAPEFMFAGQCITSPSGQYFLYVSPSDGNLFIYDLAHGRASWYAPGTPGHPGDFLNFQPNSNLVVYDSSGTINLWETATTYSGATLLNMEDDGRILLWRPVWSSGTSHGWGDTNQYTHPACDVGTGTGQTGALASGQCFVSPNGRFQLLLDANNNLVLSDTSFNPPAILWQRP